MSSKKRASKKPHKSSTTQRRSKRGTVIIYTDNIGIMLDDEDDSNGHRSKQPYRINPESDEE